MCVKVKVTVLSSFLVVRAADCSGKGDLLHRWFQPVETERRGVERPLDGGRAEMLRLHRKPPGPHFRCKSQGESNMFSEFRYQIHYSNVYDFDFDHDFNLIMISI